jgi:hypothetical protein
VNVLPRNPVLQQLIQPRYSLAEIEKIRAVLLEHGTLQLFPLPNGLFSAGPIKRISAHTGYQAVWVRDNVHIAHALIETGEVTAATATVLALADFFTTQTPRFDAIIADRSRAAVPQDRPHVKFNGYPLGEISDWPHDQNDALGYFVWIFCRLVQLGQITLTPARASVLARFPAYFHAIRFWSDEDSGHWEETRKNSASSIGVVCAACRELKALLESESGMELRPFVVPDEIDSLIDSGLQRLDQILPFECIQEPPRQRRYDAALLFLVYPLAIIDDVVGDQIIDDVQQHLQGEYGIRRYLGDSFWCTDYRRNMRSEERTRDFSSDMWIRDRFVAPGGEAQWCIFDPVLSVIFGRRYQISGDQRWLDNQTEHFNRALSQITNAYQCAELWHWETGEDGRMSLEPSDVTPLLWTQANLAMALSCMMKSMANTRIC